MTPDDNDPVHAVARMAGLARSLIMYYGPVWRRWRMTRFYGQFLRPGDLAFDIGAHVGNRVRPFRRLGARVVAVEPQPDLVAVLDRLYGRDTGVWIEPCGVADRPGSAVLHVSRRTPTVSTFAGSWITEVRRDRQFDRVRWDAELTVALTTLDALRERYGEPAFVKIDVEGLEEQVLAGLSVAVPAVSFEYIPVAIERAVACVQRLGALGDYRFRRSRVETHHWAGPAWLEGDSMVYELRGLPRHESRSGDVYGVRADVLPIIVNDDGG